MNPARLLLSPSGRVARARYAAGMLLALGAAGAVGCVALWGLQSAGVPLEGPGLKILWWTVLEGANPDVVLALAACVLPAWYWMAFCLHAKRLHDVGFTAWWAVPGMFVSNTIFTLALALYPGERGEENAWGPDPLPSPSRPENLTR